MLQPGCYPNVSSNKHALGVFNERDCIPQSLQELAWDVTKEWDFLSIDDTNKLVYTH